MQICLPRACTPSGDTDATYPLGTLSPNPGSTELAEVWHLSLWANSMIVTKDTVRPSGKARCNIIMLLEESGKCQGSGDGVPGGWGRVGKKTIVSRGRRSL
jgi:hypothetical protein